MATSIMILYVIMLAFIITPWIGEINHADLHHTDLMAGAE
jgi:hypothetical protein